MVDVENPRKFGLEVEDVMVAASLAEGSGLRAWKKLGAFFLLSALAARLPAAAAAPGRSSNTGMEELNGWSTEAVNEGCCCCWGWAVELKRFVVVVLLAAAGC